MKRFLLPFSMLAAVFLAGCSGWMYFLPGRPAEIVKENDVAIPMRDGVILRADIWRPAGDGKFPVLVYRTPYDKRRSPESYATYRKAVERGYAVVMQDVRGRYASAGEFLPYQQEGQDGYDTIEWAAKQPWSSGAVGTFGLSYPGAVQWLAAMERPPHLKAMVPAMTFSTPRNFFYSGGVFDGSWVGWVWNNIAPDVRMKKSLPGPRTGTEARAAFEKDAAKLQGRLPLAALDELKDIAPWYFEWLRHEPRDAWWEWCELRNKYDRTDAAVLNLSGWYDEAYGPEGATTNYSGVVAARKRQADKRAHLIIGPWVHGVGATKETKAGVRDFGPQSAIDYDEVVLRWMDRYVKGIDNGVEKEKPVRVFVMGRNAWREADAWPIPSTQAKPLYLSSTASTDKPGELSWTAPQKSAASSSFVSDPANPVTDPYPAYSGGHDYSPMAKRSDVLIFETAPLAQDTEVTGNITAEIYISCDAPDTDLWVKLLDVAPDGQAVNLMSPGLDVQRASYRNERGPRELLQPGRVYKLVLKNLITSNAFLKGHRIRAQISAAFFPHFSRNLHTGKLETESAEMRRATIRVHHDRKYPSRIILPIVAAK
ncbi:MAG TPA: CocE/NonD family hydrolase [Candidatus Acidoferrales bacterium]|nr:CocE/NonD family hydrolase [Candidatus Acidoferrales bacterium]